MRRALLLALLLAGCLSLAAPVQAGRGIPGSSEFGYGARLNLTGPYQDDALALAVDLPLDWLAITLPWQDYPAGSGSAAWLQLDQVMHTAARFQVPVLISLTQAPAGALTLSGPDPEQTAGYAVELARRYAPTLQALELFPAANTRQGWGADPDPAAYARLYRAVERKLQAAGVPILLVAGGLKPLDPADQAGLQDVDFLAGVYSAAPEQPFPIISLDLSVTAGEPLVSPAEGSIQSLRRYELIRQVMISANRQKDLLWITSFAPPSGKMIPSNQQQAKAQSEWLSQAYAQMRSQLYIGMVVYQSLNSTAGGSGIIQSDDEYLPFYPLLRSLIRQNAPSPPPNGRPKDEVLVKRRT